MPKTLPAAPEEPRSEIDQVPNFDFSANKSCFMLQLMATRREHDRSI
jgi:hypothetical protein